MNTDRRASRFAFATLLIAALYLILASGIYLGLTRQMQGANDFYSRWVGARALLLNNQNPYSDEVTREIQMGMYGRLASANEDQVAFAYPLFAAFPIAPLVGMPYDLAQALWMALLILAAVAASLLLVRLCRFAHVESATLAAVMLGVLVFYPTVRGVFNGQLTLLSFLFIAAALLAIDARADAAGGMLLALATIKPQPVVLLAPLALVWALRQRRLRIVSGAFVAWAVMVVVGLAFVPTWPVDFIQGLLRYAQYEPIGPPVQILGNLLFSGSAALVFTIGVSVCLLAWLAWRAAASIDRSWSDLQPTIGLAAIVTTLIGGRMGTPDQVLLLVPWLAWFGTLRRRRELVPAALGGLALIAVPWIAVLATLHGNAENPAVALVLPFVSLAVFAWQARPASHPEPEQAP